MKKEHIIMTCETCTICKGAAQSDKPCPCCDGGLAICLICGEYESGLEKDCIRPEDIGVQFLKSDVKSYELGS